MPETRKTQAEAYESPVVELLPEEKRRRFLRYWNDYLGVPGEASPEEMALQADLAAGVLLPLESELAPATAVAVATGLLRYHPAVAEGLAGGFRSLPRLAAKERLREPLNDYVVYALEELSFRLQTQARELKRQP